MEELDEVQIRQKQGSMHGSSSACTHMTSTVGPRAKFDDTYLRIKWEMSEVERTSCFQITWGYVIDTTPFKDGQIYMGRISSSLSGTEII